MQVNMELLESQLGETEMALMIAVNIALDAAQIAGNDGQLTLQHLTQHKENFGALAKPKAQHIFAALEMLHVNRMGN